VSKRTPEQERARKATQRAAKKSQETEYADANAGAAIVFVEMQQFPDRKDHLEERQSRARHFADLYATRGDA